MIFLAKNPKLDSTLHSFEVRVYVIQTSSLLQISLLRQSWFTGVRKKSYCAKPFSGVKTFFYLNCMFIHWISKVKLFATLSIKRLFQWIIRLMQLNLRNFRSQFQKQFLYKSKKYKCLNLSDLAWVNIKLPDAADQL